MYISKINMAKTPSKTPSKSKSATPKATKTASATTSVATPAVVTEVVNAPVETPLFKMESGFALLQEKLVAFRELHAQVMRDTKSLYKNVSRSIRENAKRKRPKRVLTAEEKANRTPNGFQQPVKISAELCNFLGKPEGTLVARTDVTSYFAEYVKKNELQDKKDRKLICPDDTLCKLLNLKKSDKITFFSMQTHMKHHYPKKSA